MHRKDISKPSVWIRALVLTGLTWISVIHASNDNNVQKNSVEKSDLNNDIVVNVIDLEIFGSRYLETDWTEFDWCGFREATLADMSFAGQWKKTGNIKDKPPAHYRKHFGLLLDFINDNFACDVTPLPESLKLEHYPQLLLRMTMSRDGSGDIYITDPRIGSVFFYDEGLLPRAELKGLSRPLGLAVDSKGYLLVGNDGRDNVEVYDLASGEMITAFGQGRIIMPNSVTVGPDGNIFVTDSRAHRVWMYDTEYHFVRNIGSPGSWEDELFFPVDTEIVERNIDGSLVKEVFVADQGNERIQIFDIYGGILRHIYPGECRMGTCEPPRLANLQAFDTDSLGRLHVLDNFEAVVSMLDPVSGSYLGEYGEYGEAPGYLWVPFGLVVSDTGSSIVTSGINDRLEVYILR
jgi:DNA-binding beta-propeller fold protein YncE